MARKLRHTTSVQVPRDGAASRVVSAVGFDGYTGKFVLLSYGRQGDTTTAFERKTIIAQPSDVLADAELLATQGYFSSAHSPETITAATQSSACG